MDEKLIALDYEELWKLYKDTNDEKYIDAMCEKERRDNPWVTSPII